MKKQTNRLLVFITVICIPVTFIIFILMFDHIETVYENPSEKNIQVVEEYFNTSLPRQVHTMRFAQKRAPLFDDIISIEIILSTGEGEKYIEEYSQNTYFLFEYSTIKNESYQFHILSQGVNRNSAISTMIKKNGNKQLYLYLIKLTIVALIYYCFIRLLLERSGKAKRIISYTKKNEM